MRYDYSKPELHWIRLSSIEGVGAGTFYRIFYEFPDLGLFFDDIEDSIKKLEIKARPQLMRNIKENSSLEKFNGFMETLDKKGIRAVTLLNEEYPMYLKEIQNPPPVLYVKGTLKNLTDRVISIVGTRRCTRRGYTLSFDVAKKLAKNGVAVISGMARGIDTAAHKGALTAGGVTAAVLGCGVDVIYPKENEKLYYDIMEKGAVISEYTPLTEPLSQHFPSRNRIISGMSKGVYVVESSNKGGACITVAFAMNQGRDVYAAPGSAFLPASEFTNALCENGCPQVYDAKTILDEYGWGSCEEEKQEFLQLDFLQQKVYDLLLNGDMTIEDISESLNVPQSELNITVTLMEMNGIIKRMPGLLYGLH